MELHRHYAYQYGLPQHLHVDGRRNSDFLEQSGFHHGFLDFHDQTLLLPQDLWRSDLHRDHVGAGFKGSLDILGILHDSYLYGGAVLRPGHECCS